MSDENTVIMGGTQIQIANSIWNDGEINLLSSALGQPVRKEGSDEIFVPDNAYLIGLSVEGLAESLQLRSDAPIFDGKSTLDLPLWIAGQGPGDPALFNDRIDLSNPIDLRSVTDVSIRMSTADPRGINRSIMAGEMRGDRGYSVFRYLTLHVSFDGRTISLPKIAVSPRQLDAGSSVCVTFRNERQNLQKELVAHLKANADYYSAAIYRNMDDATMFSLLNQYDWQGKPLAAQVEPRPFTVAGNYLVFMAPVDKDEPAGMEWPTAPNARTAVGAVSVAMPADQQFADVAKRFKAPPTWEQLLTERNIIGVNAKTDERLVPIPTTGVFAEAVLGRSNSAEKLDITRFWNWQDSPIPLAAPEIAAIQMGSRAQAENLTPGQLGQPAVTIVNPTQLPDPAGLAAVLGAVQNGNMFRDMSGLAGTQAAMTAAIQAAGQAGQQAGANATTGMTGAQTQATAMHDAQTKKDIAQIQADAEVAKAGIGAAPVGKEKVEGISGDGARHNLKKALEKEAADGASLALNDAIDDQSIPVLS
jgi:hypothetical protein